MMSYQTPKTDWNADNGVDFNAMNRIEGNISIIRNASEVQITDVGGYFESSDLEGALQKLGQFCIFARPLPF